MGKFSIKNLNLRFSPVVEGPVPEGPCLVQPDVEGIRVLVYWSARRIVIQGPTRVWQVPSIEAHLRGSFRRFGQKGPLDSTILDGYLVRPGLSAHDVVQAFRNRNEGRRLIELHVADVWTTRPGGWVKRTGPATRPGGEAGTGLGLIERCVGGPVVAVPTVIADPIIVTGPRIVRGLHANYFEGARVLNCKWGGRA